MHARALRGAAQREPSARGVVARASAPRGSSDATTMRWFTSRRRATCAARGKMPLELRARSPRRCGGAGPVERDVARRLGPDLRRARRRPRARRRRRRASPRSRPRPARPRRRRRLASRRRPGRPARRHGAPRRAASAGRGRDDHPGAARHRHGKRDVAEPARESAAVSTADHAGHAPRAARSIERIAAGVRRAHEDAARPRPLRLVVDKPPGAGQQPAILVARREWQARHVGSPSVRASPAAPLRFPEPLPTASVKADRFAPGCPSGRDATIRTERCNTPRANAVLMGEVTRSAEAGRVFSWGSAQQCCRRQRAAPERATGWAFAAPLPSAALCPPVSRQSDG